MEVGDLVTWISLLEIPGLTAQQNAQVVTMFDQLNRKRFPNNLHTAHYEAEEQLKRIFNGVIPEPYYSLGLVLGWCGKGVDALADRINLEDFDWPDGQLNDLGMNELMEDNQLVSEVKKAAISTLIHGCSFVVASKGGRDEPGGLLHFYSAKDATGIWNPRTRRLDAFLVVISWGEDGDPTSFIVMVPGKTLSAKQIDSERWLVTTHTHGFGVPAVILPYKPRLERPFGQSRITHAAMGIQSAGVRDLIRAEGHSDAYAFPVWWLFGPDESIFKDADARQVSSWALRLGRTRAIPDNYDAPQGANPRAEVKEFASHSPEPHLAMLNVHAKLIAREFSLPDSALALTDLANPTSADAYDASQYELIARAEATETDWATPLNRVVRIALAMKNDLRAVPEEWRTIRAHWRDPRFTSRAAQADAGVKQISAASWLGETRIGLELLGLTPRQIDLAMADRDEAQARLLASQIADGRQVDQIDWAALEADVVEVDDGVAD